MPIYIGTTCDACGSPLAVGDRVSITYYGNVIDSPVDSDMGLSMEEDDLVGVRVEHETCERMGAK